MKFIEQAIADFSSFIWRFSLLICGGFYLLIRSQFLPFLFFDYAIQVLKGKYDDPKDVGEITYFQTLITVLSTTVGMGNIVGVTIVIGVSGAVFWMWMSAIIGMSIKFFTATLAIMYRGKDSEEKIQGSSMYFIMEGLGKSWKPLMCF